MVQIREAEVSCLHLFAAFVHVHVVLDVLEPLERLSKEHVFLNEDTTVLVKDMEDNQSPLYGIEVVLEITVRLFFHPVLEYQDDVIYQESCFFSNEVPVVALVENSQLKARLFGKPRNVL